MAKVNAFDGEVWARDLEICASCRELTFHWWGYGCMPLCPMCAEKLSEGQAYRLAKKMKFGPLPEPPEAA